MSKQTAVEWLVEQMISQMGIRIENTTIGEELFEQAKAMEREQIVEAWCDEMPRMVFALRAERYYERTYGKEASHESI